MTANLPTTVTFAVYLLAMLLVGWFGYRATANLSDYILGGRSLGSVVTALSAGASDMSGWLLMGLPGVAYWCGLADAAWTAIGLALGTYLNWLLVAKRLRSYSVVAGNAITIPDFFSNRFREKRKVIMTIASLFILIFFTVYASSCFVTCGKLFSTMFGQSYRTMMIAGAAFVVIYTFLGGFLAESASDFMQAIVMIFALALVLIAGVAAAGGFGAVVENSKAIPGFFTFFGIASPTVDVSGVQAVSEAGAPLFGAAGSYGLLTIISTMSWGLGYFGMPQVLLRFMGIRSEHELTRSRRVATVWVVISLASAVCIGLIGRVLFPDAYMVYGSGNTENIFILLSTTMLPPLLAGLVCAGILAAAISSSDSYLLISASAVSKNIWQGLLRKKASEKETMWVSRIVLVLITVFAIFVATGKNQVIFSIVDFAWAGFGAAFGPLMLFSLFWKRTTYAGAIAGMLSGGAMVFIWNFFISKLGGVWGIYELLPAFLFACIVIVVVSLLTKKPGETIEKEFEAVRTKT